MVKEHRLRTPIERAEVEKLELGDIVYVSGTVFTIRDLSHQRIAEYMDEGRVDELPFDLKDKVVFHCGPIIETLGEGKWRAVSVGPTSSSRFSSFVTALLGAMGPRLIVGKGFLTEEAIEGLVSCGGAVLEAVGGCAALYAAQVREVANQYWPEFGMVDAAWEFRVEEFGPLSVEIDCRGNSSYKRFREVTLKGNMSQAYTKLGLDPDSDFIWWPRVVVGTREAVRYATSTGGGAEC